MKIPTIKDTKRANSANKNARIVVFNLKLLYESIRNIQACQHVYLFVHCFTKSILVMDSALGELA